MGEGGVGNGIIGGWRVLPDVFGLLVFVGLYGATNLIDSKASESPSLDPVLQGDLTK
jgi:hypothetical protein